jgi:hypothetical protein
MDDEAWVYWCIDDRYPLRLIQPAVDELTKLVQAEAMPEAAGIMFCRWGKMWLPDSTVPGEERVTPGGATLLRRRDYSQIWLHQFLRVKVLRHLFERLPDAVPQAIALDPLKHKVAMPGDHRLYVVQKNLAVFGESTTRGRVTRNCAQSLRRKGIDVPPGFPETDEEISMGALD